MLLRIQVSLTAVKLYYCITNGNTRVHYCYDLLYIIKVVYRAPATGPRSWGIVHRQPAINNKLAP